VIEPIEEVLMNNLRRRSVSAQRSGLDGFIPIVMLSFDVGRSTKLVRRKLDVLVEKRVIERNWSGRCYVYRSMPELIATH